MSYNPNDTVGTYSGNGPAGSGLDQFMGGYEGKIGNMYGDQYNQLKDFWNGYQNKVNGQQSANSMFQQYGNAAGLPNLMSASNTLNSTLANLPNTWGSASRGFDVNANQLSRIIGQKTYEMTPAVQSTNQALGNAQNYVGQQVGYGQQENQRQLLPYQMQGQMLGDFQARQSTGYTQALQNELDGYIKKMQTGAQLSTDEQQRANALAQIDKQYQDQLDNWKAKMGYNGQINLAALLGLTGGA